MGTPACTRATSYKRTHPSAFSAERRAAYRLAPTRERTARFAPSSARAMGRRSSGRSSLERTNKMQWMATLCVSELANTRTGEPRRVLRALGVAGSHVEACYTTCHTINNVIQQDPATSRYIAFHAILKILKHNSLYNPDCSRA